MTDIEYSVITSDVIKSFDCIYSFFACIQPVPQVRTLTSYASICCMHTQNMDVYKSKHKNLGL